MKEPENSPPEDQPPVLGSWRNMYIFVLLLHVFIIYLFVRFSEAYA